MEESGETTWMCNISWTMAAPLLKLYDGLLLYRSTYSLKGQGKHTKPTSEIYSTLVAL